MLLNRCIGVWKSGLHGTTSVLEHLGPAPAGYGKAGLFQPGKHGSVLFSIATFEQFRVKNMNFQTCYIEIWMSMADFDISNTRSTVSGWNHTGWIWPTPPNNSPNKTLIIELWKASLQRFTKMTWKNSQQQSSKETLFLIEGNCDKRTYTRLKSKSIAELAYSVLAPSLYCNKTFW